MTDWCIVGHGRSPEERGWGEQIDACDNVIRMWNWHWQKPEDYGTKYDYGMIDVAKELIDQFYSHNRHEPAKGYIGFLHRYAKPPKWPDGLEFIEIGPWVAIAESMGGSPEHTRMEFTRGTMAACWAISQTQRDDRVILVGFDTVVLGRAQPVEQAASPEYQASDGIMEYSKTGEDYLKNYKSNVRRYGFTDYGIEYPMMHHIAEFRGVKLVLAQAIWP